MEVPVDTSLLELVVGDLTDRASLFGAAEGCQRIFHLGAEYSFWSLNPALTYQSNIDGTRNIMEAALQYKPLSVVYCSTVGTMGLLGQPAPSDESTPMDPEQLTSHYKRSKHQAEQVALRYLDEGVPLVVVNPSAPIGALDRKPTPTGKIIVDFVNGKMPAFVETGLNLVHVQDVAEGHILASERGKIGERYILGNQNLKLSEIFEALASITGKPAPHIRIPYGMAYLAGLFETKFADWITHSPPSVPLEAVKMSKRTMFFNAAKAVQELGLPQTSVEKALQDSVNWFAKNHYFDRLTANSEIMSMEIKEK